MLSTLSTFGLYSGGDLGLLGSSLLHQVGFILYTSQLRQPWRLLLLCSSLWVLLSCCHYSSWKAVDSQLCPLVTSKTCCRPYYSNLIYNFVMSILHRFKEIYFMPLNCHILFHQLVECIRLVLWGATLLDIGLWKWDSSSATCLCLTTFPLKQCSTKVSGRGGEGARIHGSGLRKSSLPIFRKHGGMSRS